MQKFKDNQVELLKALKDIVEDNIDYAQSDYTDKDELAELIEKLTNKRSKRRLVSIKKELVNLIDLVKKKENL